MVIDPYIILKVQKNCNIEDIKKAFRTQAKKCHPDIIKDNGEKFKELKNAYDYLLNDHHYEFKKYNDHKFNDIFNNVKNFSMSEIDEMIKAESLKPKYNKNKIYYFDVVAKPQTFYEKYRNVSYNKTAYSVEIILEENDIDIINGINICLNVKNIRSYIMQIKLNGLPAPVHNETISVKINYRETLLLNIKIKEYL